jgi:hypothetical protein
MKLMCEGDGLVLHAVMQLCRFGFQIGRDKPVGGARCLDRATGDPELHDEEGKGRQDEEQDDKELEVIADAGEAGADA